jgi:DNA-binding transcriptional LysR family regulator
MADEKNFTRTARRMNVSQSTLSRNIQRLEELLGRRLLERTTRKVNLTQAGEGLYGKLRTILPRLEEALLLEQENDSFHLGFSWGLPTGWPQEVFANFEEQTGVSVHAHRNDSQLAGVDHGDVDLAILRGIIDAPDMEVVTILREQQIAAVSIQSELSFQEEMSWTEIAEHDIVVNKVSGTTSLDDWPAEKRPRVSKFCRNFDEWLVAVASNKGVGVAPELVGRQNINSCVSFIPIKDAPSVPLSLVYPKYGHHPLVQCFVTMARTAVGAGREESTAMLRPAEPCASGL